MAIAKKTKITKEYSLSDTDIDLIKSLAEKHKLSYNPNTPMGKREISKADRLLYNLNLIN